MAWEHLLRFTLLRLRVWAEQSRAVFVARDPSGLDFTYHLAGPEQLGRVGRDVNLGLY